MEKTMGNRPVTRVRAMVECAMLIAAFMVLSRLKIIHMPQGGDLTPAAGLPLLLIGYRHGWKWGGLSAAAATGLTMLLDGFYAPPANTAAALVLCLLLDYFLAQFTIVSAAGITYFLRKRSTVTVGISVLASQLLNFFSHFLSGVLLWGSYAPEGMSVPLYSFLYNGGIYFPESLLTTVAAVAIFRTAPGIFSRQ